MHVVLSARIRRAFALVGTSRHSALPALRQQVDLVTRPFVVRAVALLVGSTMIGTAVSLLVEARLGLAPYDVFSSGITIHTGMTLGQAGWCVAGVLFVVASLLGHRPSIWGVAYIVANGFAVDAAAGLLNTPNGMAVRIAFLVAGIVVMAVGVNVVLFSGTTGGPFELLMLAGEDRGVSRISVRSGLDVSVLVLGVLLGGVVGIGTLIYAATMGLTLQVIGRAFADYRLGRELRHTRLPADFDFETRPLVADLQLDLELH